MTNLKYRASSELLIVLNFKSNNQYVSIRSNPIIFRKIWNFPVYNSDKGESLSGELTNANYHLCFRDLRSTVPSKFRTFDFETSPESKLRHGDITGQFSEL